MSFTARFEKKTFIFKRPSGTSRGILTEKHAWFIYVKAHNSSFEAIGECSIIPGLSPDFESFEVYENKVADVCENINRYATSKHKLANFPSIQFGLETALLNLSQQKELVYFDTDFTKGKQKLAINGLIWMGDEAFMQEQIEQKIEEGFSCIKMKIGAIDFDTEIKLLSSIRKRFDSSKIEIRVDANGAFAPNEALAKLERLSDFDLHSIEQPIKQGLIEKMKQLCLKTPLPIALDEELIGIHKAQEKKQLLETIKPQYIILKPSLVGGLSGTQEWISLAETLSIPWWITSALESNVGLSAIAQFTSQYKDLMYQGLGTGSLYTNNIESKLVVEKGYIYSKYNLE